jgi:hypothetical protein
MNTLAYRLKRAKFVIAGLLAVVLVITAAGPAAAIPLFHNHHIAHKAAWAGAGFAAGRFAGPAGSATVGVAKYRDDLKAGGKRRISAIRKIGAPIAAGAIAGPAGTVAYEAVEHRSWIKRHIFHHTESAPVKSS